MKKVNLLDIPKIKTIKVLANHRLKAGFVGGQTRVYDFRPLLDKYEAFDLLKNEAFFKAVNVCQTGRGVVWDENRDLAASEIWINGNQL